MFHVLRKYKKARFYIFEYVNIIIIQNFHKIELVTFYNL